MSNLTSVDYAGVSFSVPSDSETAWTDTYLGCIKLKKKNGIVYVNIQGTTRTTLYAGSWTSIGNIPVEYAPDQNTYAVVNLTEMNTTITFMFSTNGVVSALSKTEMSSGKSVYASASFIAAS